MSVGRVQLNAPPRREPFEANLYVVQRGENKTVVLYWYQSRDRIVASEYTARVFLVADSLRYNRSDTTLVRAMMPFQGDDAGPASEGLRRFVEAFFGPLQAILPS
jgi:EpsI family protein